MAANPGQHEPLLFICDNCGRDHRIFRPAQGKIQYLECHGCGKLTILSGVNAQPTVLD